MGCCFSSTAPTRKADDQKSQNPTKSHHSPLKPLILQSDKTPPPPPQEEEEEEEAVIKEVLVLSETSTLYKKEQEKITQTPLPPKPQPDHVSSPIKKPTPQQQEPQHPRELEISNLSQVSEMTETMSTTATTTTTATTATATKAPKEDEATSKDNSDLKRKSPANLIKKRPSNGERGNVRARTVDPSPEKKARGRGRGLGEVTSTSVPRNVGSRSRSPGTGRAGGVGSGRGSVGKTTTTVTGKTDHSKPVAPMTAEGQSQKEEGGNGGEVVEQQGTESLENPLVSLECFIFL